VPPGRLARLKNIQMNRQVALLIDEYDEDWTRLWYVLVRGEAELVSSLAERAHALAQLQAKYPQYRSGMLADDGPILRITPLRISTWGKLTNTAAEPER
jgi:PPOX class probable F420-dependent enzyme